MVQFDQRRVLEFGAALALWLVSPGSSQASFQSNSAPPVFSHPTEITNPLLPLGSLKQDILDGKEGGVAVRVERTRQAGTKSFTVDGKTIRAMIVEDRTFAGGKLEEIALDYFAQSDDGTVYYLGEQVDNYKGGKVANHDGTWLYGVHTKKLGILMPARPALGDRFRSKDVPGITRENDEVVSISETVTVPAGTYTNCVKVKEVLSDGKVEYKFYALKVGVVRELPVDGQVDLRTHSVDVKR